MKIEIGAACTFLILLILFLVYVYICAPTLKSYCKKEGMCSDTLPTLEELEPLQSGDLLFLGGPTYFEKCVKWTTKCPFSHVAFVVRDVREQKLYLFECDRGQHYKDGVRYIPLQEKLNRYKGERIGAIVRLKTDRPLNQNALKKIIEENLHKDMQSRMYSHLLSDYPNSVMYQNVYNPDKAFCSEVIADAYQKLALMDGEKLPTYYTPADFFMRKINLQDGVRLDSPIFFKF